MIPSRFWKSTPAALRQGLSGIFAGALGGAVLVGLVLALDIARLRTLLSMVIVTPSAAEWLTVPSVFAAAGLAVALTCGRGG